MPVRIADVLLERGEWKPGPAEEKDGKVVQIHGPLKGFPIGLGAVHSAGGTAVPAVVIGPANAFLCQGRTPCRFFI